MSVSNYVVIAEQKRIHSIPGTSEFFFKRFCYQLIDGDANKAFVFILGKQ